MIQLSYRDAKPICEQVKDSLRRLILLDIIHENEKMPSVKELACSLAISPHTIQRAYQDLQMEGFLYQRADEEIFSSPNRDLLQTENLQREYTKLLEQFDRTVDELFDLSKSAEELKARIDLRAAGGTYS